MEVCRKSSWLFLLLGLLCLSTSLQGVQGEVDSEGPSESECRPYIEKALKELETAEAIEQRDPGDADRDSNEDVPTVEITTDDSDHEDGDGDNDVEEEGTDSSENVEDTHDEINNTKEEIDVDNSEEQADEGTSSENEIGSNEDNTSKEDNESKEGNESTQDNGSKEDNESKEENASKEDNKSEEDNASKEDDGSKEDDTLDKNIVDSNEDSEKGDENVDNASTENQKSSEEGTDVEDDQHSEEVLETPVEDSVESTEGKSVTTGDTTETVDADIDSEEENKSDENSNESTDDTKETVIESDKKEEESSEDQDQAEPNESKEVFENANNDQDNKEVIGDVQDDSSDESKSVEDAGTTSKEEDDKTTSKEEDDKTSSKEDDKNDTSDETNTDANDPLGKEDDTKSEEKGKESEEDDTDSKENTNSSVKEDENDDNTSDNKSSEEILTRIKKDVVNTESENLSKEVNKNSKEIVDDEAASEVNDKEESRDANETEREDTDKITEDDNKEDSKEEENDSSDDRSDNSAPEEDLINEGEIPEDLRPTDHIIQLLKLDDDNLEIQNTIDRVADITLKDLKKMYENAIKPLEVLYKYRDLSNRHFGDAEIFAKPLVLFMGPWSGGKSSIINYLVDNEYNETSLRTGAEPSPAYFNILMYGDEPEVLDGTQLAADFTLSGLQKFGQGLEERLRGLKLPKKLLEKINIVEIPGILEVRKQVSRIFPFNDACQWFIDRADIIFLVYDPSKLDVGPETEAILDQLKGREHQTRIVLNKADQVKPEELMRVQSALIWNISPLMSSAQPPVMYTTSLWSRPYEPWAPIRLLQAQERAFLRDIRSAIDKRIENKISSARRFAVRVRNHAKMVDCYLTTYYNHKSVFGNRKQVADAIIEHPQDYHIYEGLSTLTNISRYDLPDPDIYRDFFRLNPLYDFQQLSATCTYFRGCPINRLDVAIAYDLPELVGKYKRMVESALAAANQTRTPGS